MAELRTDAQMDSELLAELGRKNENYRYHSDETGLDFVNGELADMAHETYDEQNLVNLENHLTQRGTLNIPVHKDGYITVGGERVQVTVVPATEIAADGANHGDMSEMVYLRDQIQAASALMELNLNDKEKYRREGETGHTLLLSAMDLMSTPAQLERFEHVIAVGDAAGQEDWPHISLFYNDLDGVGPNGWRNKQDTLQMLAYASLDALDSGFLSEDDLSEAHKKFLSSIVPFLKSVGYPRYENSGSWEEVATERTSVMAVETALLHKIQTLSADPAYAFLHDRTDQETLDGMVTEGLTELGRRLPFESPDYPDGIKHRDADAALAYVLMYDLPKLMEDAHVKVSGVEMNKYEIENLVLDQLYTLIDHDTNGIKRYPEDSYQGINFHTPGMQTIVNGVKDEVKAKANGGEVDYALKQALRAERTTSGKEAAWTHPLGQLAAWAAERSLQETQTDNPDKAAEYRALGTRFVNLALSTVTGDGQYNAVQNGDREFVVQPVTPDRLPEAYITYRLEDGTSFQVPSPHTPLNWSAAMLRKAVGLLRVSTRAANKQMDVAA